MSGRAAYLRAAFWFWAMQVFPRWKAAARRANDANKQMWQQHAPRGQGRGE